MDSFELIEKYWKYNSNEFFGSSVTALYFFLLYKWENNKRVDFQLSDAEASKYLKLSRKTIKTAKDSLRQNGLITFKITEGYPTLYKIIVDYTLNTQQKDDTIISKKQSKNPPSLIEKEIGSVNNNSNPNIPTLEEFMNYAKTLDIYKETDELNFKIKAKYNTWASDGWKNGHGKPIRNWKIALQSSMPYLTTAENKNSIFNIPKINRPKNTYNE